MCSGWNDLRVPALLLPTDGPHAVRLVQRRPHRLVVGARDAVPLVEALMGGEALLGAAEMPLAPHARGVALRRQQLRDGDLPLRQPVRGAADRDFVGPGPDREAARHQRRARRRALRLDVEVEQPHAFAGELVDARRGRAAQDAAAIDAQLAIAEVVREHENDIRLVPLRPTAGPPNHAMGLPRCKHSETGLLLACADSEKSWASCLKGQRRVGRMKLARHCSQ